MKSKMWKRIAGIVVFAALVVYVATPRLVHATFPGQNGRISFASSGTNSTSIFTVRPDGSGELQLTSDSANQSSVDSNWSPDGSRIAFDNNRSIPDIQDIFTMKADGTNVVQLTSNAGFNGEPVYSPDGQTIAFDSDRGSGQNGIYLMNAADGTNVRRVTMAPVGFFDAFPHFSPADDRLVFSRVNTCAPRHGPGPPSGVAGCLAAVFLVNINGSGLTQMTPYGKDISATDWSPDGTKLLLESRFDTVHGSEADVLLINVEGSNLVNLTNNPPISGVSGAPCSGSDNAKFSPDGTKLVFVQFDCVNQPKLWIMNADGSGKHDTGIVVGGNVFGSGGVGLPDWGTNQN